MAVIFLTVSHFIKSNFNPRKSSVKITMEIYLGIFITLAPGLNFEINVRNVQNAPA
jgi:hypothetical protein